MKTGDGIKPFSQYKDIFDFYEKTGMGVTEANEYLLNELKRSGVDANKTRE